MNRYGYPTIRRDTIFVPYVRKDGKPSKRLLLAWGPPYMELVYCQLCGKAGPRKYISPRNVYGWDSEDKYDYSESKNLLCVGCWNTCRAIFKKEQGADECKSLINKIQRRIAWARKQVIG